MLIRTVETPSLTAKLYVRMLSGGFRWEVLLRPQNGPDSRIASDEVYQSPFKALADGLDEIESLCPPTGDGLLQ